MKTAQTFDCGGQNRPAKGACRATPMAIVAERERLNAETKKRGVILAVATSVAYPTSVPSAPIKQNRPGLTMPEDGPKKLVTPLQVRVVPSGGTAVTTDAQQPGDQQPASAAEAKDNKLNLDRAVTLATVAGFICAAAGIAAHLTAVISALALLAFAFWHYMLRRNAGLKRAVEGLPRAPAMLLTMLLVGALTAVLLRQHSIDQKGIDVGELAESFHRKVWWCFGNEPCIAKALESLAESVPVKSDTPVERLFTDQAMGEIARGSEPSVKLLKKAYGVQPNFLGIGSSIPSGQTLFVGAHTPEYLIPNYPDKHQGVFAWKFDPTGVRDKPSILDLLKNNPPFNAQTWGGKQRKESWEAILIHSTPRAKVPALIRFALVPELPKGKYSGCLGRSESRAVFASDLGTILRSGMTFEEAAGLSGYTMNAKSGNQQLYVFIFIPSHPEELLEPSWKQILSHIEGDLAQPSPCNVGS